MGTGPLSAITLGMLSGRVVVGVSCHGVCVLGAGGLLLSVTFVGDLLKLCSCLIKSAHLPLSPAYRVDLQIATSIPLSQIYRLPQIPAVNSPCQTQQV